MRLCVERGVDAVSVRDIAAACDMKASNLYAHFASKDALVVGLFHKGYGEYGDLLAEAPKPPRDPARSVSAYTAWSAPSAACTTRTTSASTS